VKTAKKLSDTERMKNTHTCLLKLPFLVELQQNLGELLLSINSCSSIIILESTLN
jgi:hypothetical protein